MRKSQSTKTASTEALGNGSMVGKMIDGKTYVRHFLAFGSTNPKVTRHGMAIQFSEWEAYVDGSFRSVSKEPVAATNAFFFHGPLEAAKLTELSPVNFARRLGLWMATGQVPMEW